MIKSDLNFDLSLSLKSNLMVKMGSPDLVLVLISSRLLYEIYDFEI